MKPQSLLSLFAFAALSACGDDGSGAGSFGTQNEDTYAVVSLTWTVETGSMSYVNLVRTLDAQPSLTLATAREFAGYAPVDASRGYVFVGSGEAPTLQRFGVSDDGAWSESAAIGFNAFASTSLTGSVYVSSGKAYAPLGDGNHVLWNPEAMTVIGELGIPSELPATLEGLSLWKGYGHELSAGLVYEPYYYATAGYDAFATHSRISVIDTDDDAHLAVIDAPCPHLHITSQDEAGNVYMSNGNFSVPSAVAYPSQPANCMVRIQRGEATLDPTFTRTFKELTDGREGSNLFYIDDDVALFNVYHAERDTLPADPGLAFAAIKSSSSYHLWTLNTKTGEAAIMDGVDFGGGQYTAFRIDGRVLVAIPSGDLSTTAVYEMSAHAPARKLFDVQGWAFKIFRVR